MHFRRSICVELIERNLQELNTELADRTYLTGNTFTDADQLIYNGLRPFYVMAPYIPK